MPACSCGFCVATTKKGSGRRYVVTSVLTCRSSIASSSALCAFGLARFTSSASSSCVNSGPLRKWNCCVLRSKTDTPMMSAGSRSLVNCTRCHARPKTWASACARVVLPTPGTSSIKRCPRARRQATARRNWAGLPRMIVSSVAIACCSRSLMMLPGGCVPARAVARAGRGRARRQRCARAPA